MALLILKWDFRATGHGCCETLLVEGIFEIKAARCNILIFKTFIINS